MVQRREIVRGVAAALGLSAAVDVISGDGDGKGMAGRNDASPAVHAQDFTIKSDGDDLIVVTEGSTIRFEDAAGQGLATELSSLTGDIAGGAEITDLVGQNLEVSSGALQLVSALTAIASINGDLTGGTRLDSIVGNNLLVENNELSALSSSDYLYAEAFDGADADERLDNAIASAFNGTKIYLERGGYADTREITTKLAFEGTGYDTSGTFIGGDWTFSNEDCSIQNVHLGADITFAANYCFATMVKAQPLDGFIVQNSNCIITQMTEGNITLEGFSSDCTVDALSAVSVTDNGVGNVIGENA